DRGCGSGAPAWTSVSVYIYALKCITLHNYACCCINMQRVNIGLEEGAVNKKIAANHLNSKEKTHEPETPARRRPAARFLSGSRPATPARAGGDPGSSHRHHAADHLPAPR